MLPLELLGEQDAAQIRVVPGQCAARFRHQLGTRQHIVASSQPC